MGRPDGRIEKGQRLNRAISARAWNRAQDAADHVLGVRPGVDAESLVGASAPYQWVYCKNTTGSLVGRWGMMRISGTLEITPTSIESDAATRQFQEMPVLRGATISGSDSRFVVALEPIATNKIGRVAVSGVVQIRAADKSKASGATVLWENETWSLIRFGGDGGGDSVRLCKTSAFWPKGEIATLNVWENGDPPDETQSPGSSVVAVNKFTQVLEGKFVIVAKAGNGAWYLIAAEC